MPKQPLSVDPMEAMIAYALDAAKIPYTREMNGLDFYLPTFDVYIEVKQFHSTRIADQMGRVDNVIAAQGRGAVSLLCGLIAVYGQCTNG